jgi:hypothetical protein
VKLAFAESLAELMAQPIGMVQRDFQIGDPSNSPDSFAILEAWSCHVKPLKTVSGTTRGLPMIPTTMNPQFLVRIAGGRFMKSRNAVRIARTISPRRMHHLA